MEQLTKYVLTVGLNDKDTKKQEIATKVAMNIVEQCLQVHTDGYTISQTLGGYRHEDGSHFVREKSIKIEMLFTSIDTVYTIAKELKVLLNQESIAFEKVELHSTLL